MKTLRARLTLALGAVGLVLVTLLDVAYVLSTQREAVSRRELILHNAALEIAAALGAGQRRHRIERLMKHIAARDALVLRVQGDMESLRSGDETLPNPPDGSSVLGGFAHVTAPAPPPWTRVIASQALEIAVDHVVLSQRKAVPLIIASLLLMVALGLWLLRRTILRPIARMTEILSAQDTDALTTMEQHPVDDIAQLVRAVSNTQRRDDEAKARIAQQLEELERTHAELSAAHKQIIRAERLAIVGQLAAGLAHELGNPLAILSGYVDVARSLEPRELDDALGRMEKELNRINALVRNLLDFSRAKDRARGRGDVRNACAHVRGLLAPQEALKGIHVHWILPDHPLPSGVDTDAITQVLLNLLLNAADALKHHGHVWISASKKETKVVLVVEDDGPGLGEEVRHRLFEPFFTTKAAGTGLGLSVCEQIVSAAGGDIDAGDREGGGSRFVVTLPSHI